MKSTVEENRAEIFSEYPKQMKTKREGMIVLFSDPEIGTVINVGDQSIWLIGYHAKDWDMKKFIPFHGKVTLESE